MSELVKLSDEIVLEGRRKYESSDNIDEWWDKISSIMKILGFETRVDEEGTPQIACPGMIIELVRAAVARSMSYWYGVEIKKERENE